MTNDLSEIKKVLRSVWWTQKRLDADLERLAALTKKNNMQAALMDYLKARREELKEEKSA